MATRAHVHEESFPAAPKALFALLCTPSAIRRWWSASRVVVVPETGGVWVAAWGDDEDRPDYVTLATIQDFDPPRRLLLGGYRYRAREGRLPFDADFTTEFLVQPHDAGSLLRVTQDGFPFGAEADPFYEACRRGWEATFAGIRSYLETVPVTHGEP